jgi:hypothetical protein
MKPRRPHPQTSVEKARRTKHRSEKAKMKRRES